MERRPFLLALAAALLACACTGAGYQVAPRPGEGAGVPPDRCRVYVARQDVLAGSWRGVRVYDGDEEVGVLREAEYLCWDRPAARGLGRVVFEGLGPDQKAVENVFDLPREAGATAWLAIEVEQRGHRPVVRLLSPEEGRALMAERRPASTR